MNNNYYRIFSTNDPDIPMLKEKTETDCLYKTRRKVEDPELMVFDFAHPIPENAKLVDFHSTPRTVFSQEIYEVLAPLNISTVNLIPSVIEDINRIQHENY